LREFYISYISLIYRWCKIELGIYKQFDILNDFQFMWVSRSMTSMVPDGKSEKTQKHFFNQECCFLHDKILSRLSFFVSTLRETPRKWEWRNASITVTSISLYVFHLSCEVSWAVYSYWRNPRIAFVAYHIVNADMCKRPCDFSFGNV